MRFLLVFLFTSIFTFAQQSNQQIAYQFFINGEYEKAIALYRDLLGCSENKSLYIEEYAREMVKTEEIHSIEIKKLLKDYD